MTKHRVLSSKQWAVRWMTSCTKQNKLRKQRAGETKRQVVQSISWWDTGRTRQKRLILMLPREERAVATSSSFLWWLCSRRGGLVPVCGRGVGVGSRGRWRWTAGTKARAVGSERGELGMLRWQRRRRGRGVVGAGAEGSVKIEREWVLLLVIVKWRHRTGIGDSGGGWGRMGGTRISAANAGRSKRWRPICFAYCRSRRLSHLPLWNNYIY